jgi:hypothetical protein
MRRRTFLLAFAALAAACSESIAPARGLEGNWRMTSFDGLAVPATYAEFFDEPVGDRIVEHVIIRLDSASKIMRADSTYERRYFFSELHDGVIVIRYLWGDHGTFTVGVGAADAIHLVSEYIENLDTPGTIAANGELHLSEELWVGETPRATIWTRRE